jgi:integrase
VHPRLIELGLDRWAEARRGAGHTRWFPELPYDQGKGYSKAAVKQFSAYMARLGYKRDGKLTFHSFRHAFVNRLPDATPERLRRQLLGHERGQDVHDKIYTKDATPDQALPFLADLKVRLPMVVVFDVSEGLGALGRVLMNKRAVPARPRRVAGRPMQAR